MKKLLMVCYYFPPLGMGGVQRPAKFAKYLSSFGWKPTVITVHPIVYWAHDPGLLAELQDVDIIRSESLDPQRILAKYRRTEQLSPNSLREKSSLRNWVLEQVAPYFFVPDSKIFWRRHALQSVQTLLENESFDALYTTSPPHSVHLIGRTIAQQYGLDWVADFRDAWAQGVVVHEPTFFHRWLHRSLQRSVLQSADAIVAVSDGISGQLDGKGEFGKKMHIIPNGFDPADFPQSVTEDARFTFCHSGSITAFSEPTPVLRAMQMIKQEHPHVFSRLRVVYIGLDTTGKFPQQVAEMGLADKIIHYGYQSHHHALQQVMSSQALILVALGKTEDHFIPGKTFEYLGSGKPIVAITNVRDTVHLLQKSGAAHVCHPEDIGALATAMLDLVHGRRSWFRPQREYIARFDRRRQTEQLAGILNSFGAQKVSGTE